MTLSSMILNQQSQLEQKRMYSLPLALQRMIYEFDMTYHIPWKEIQLEIGFTPNYIKRKDNFIKNLNKRFGTQSIEFERTLIKNIYNTEQFECFCGNFQDLVSFLSWHPLFLFEVTRLQYSILTQYMDIDKDHLNEIRSALRPAANKRYKQVVGNFLSRLIYKGKRWQLMKRLLEECGFHRNPSDVMERLFDIYKAKPTNIIIRKSDDYGDEVCRTRFQTIFFVLDYGVIKQKYLLS